VAPEFFFQKKMRAQSNLNYVSVDIDLKTSLAMQEMDITKINRPDESVDVFLCSHVLEHIPDDRKAMREIFRVLKKDGWALLQVPIDENRSTTFEDPSVTTPQEREKVFGQNDHVRIYGRDYVDRLKEAGFVVNMIDYARHFPPEIIEKHRLATDEKIYFCTRPNGPRLRV
jgi:predicted SAM-dependent methyltransferase